MLPCRPGCAAYHDGCHKDCAHWRDYQARQREERQAKKRYLREYHEVCGCVARQLRASTLPCRLFR